MRQVFFDIKMTDDQDDFSEHHDTGVVTEEARPEVKRPSMYRVVLLNDDYTPMDFVVNILMVFFAMDQEKATQVMLAVHTKGKGVCGVFTHDVAETKAAQVNQYARDNSHPLLCEVEKA
ncbi:ATP-dependent Clp protease adapter ClpS [Amphritea balenae]|nr:ATP-dependent Clp protease adapter ClpS [Amphritea balenae]GGK81643.1 ATP-dependent Clp protease adapter protein ClpS [Amphritea balenae]